MNEDCPKEWPLVHKRIGGKERLTSPPLPKIVVDATLVIVIKSDGVSGSY